MRELLRWVAGLALLGTGTVAGVHFVYYLYNWEWVRAQVAGTAFVACLVVGVGGVVLDRLDRHEREVLRRLDELAALTSPSPSRAAAPTTVTAVRSDGVPADESPAAPPQRSPDGSPDVPWLDPAFAPSRTWSVLPLVVLATPLAEPRGAVFIPVLLGAGIALSLVAGAVERVAGFLSRRRGREPARRATGTPSAGGLAAGAGGRAPVRASRPPSTATARRRLLLGGVVALVVAAAAVGTLWQLAHYRPVALGDGLTALTVRVDSKTAPRPAEETVDLVARWCAVSAIDGVQVRAVGRVAEDTAQLVVSPLLDEQAERRFSGCIEDANLERHRLVVTGSEHLTTTGRGDDLTLADRWPPGGGPR